MKLIARTILLLIIAAGCQAPNRATPYTCPEDISEIPQDDFYKQYYCEYENN